MCGITGFVSSKGSYTKQDLISMTDILAHRGPNDAGYYFDNYAGLGHRRLSVMDLSNAGHQPMYSHCGKYLIVFNGEVYNFKEIAREIDINPQTGTDTEIILEAFVQKGPGFVSMLNGMFAFVIYEISTQTMWAYRDRVGVKPLLFYYENNNFAFGSELKAIKSLLADKIKLEINANAIYEYLHLGFVAEPNTIYEKIKKFPVGHYMELKKNAEPEFIKYWDIFNNIKKQNDSFEEAKEKLKYLIYSSVNYRMMSDVPFGTFLSGGIDSSLVTAVASRISSQPINTFTIGFEDKSYSEALHASKVAQALGTNHHELILSEKESSGLLHEIVESYDEPFSDTSAIPTLLISKYSREHVTMTLAGDGGDELFQGYGAYNWAKRLDNPFLHRFKGIFSYALKKMPDNRSQRASLLFDYKTSEDKFDHIFSQEQYLFSKYDALNLIKDKSVSAKKINLNFNEFDFNLDIQSKQALFDFKYYLKDDLLVKVDRASMKFSLETRVPLLDYRIAEYAFGLPIQYKKFKGQSKYILKSILYDHLPQEMFNRPKRGFSIPLVRWLKSDLKYLIHEYTKSEINNRFGILDDAKIQTLVKDFLSGKDYLYNKVWLVINLNMWLIKNA